MGNAKKIGNWSGVKNLTKTLGSDIDKACNQSAMQFGLIAEGIAKEHISKQDLGWEPLNEDYKEWKENKGRSNNILVSTSSYFQSITSWAENKTGYAGVNKKAKDENGEVIADIAKTHEYGTSNAGKNKNVTIPARPLWQPTLKEAFERWNETSTPIVLLRKKYNL